jgi:hypothetical protein
VIALLNNISNEVSEFLISVAANGSSSGCSPPPGLSPPPEPPESPEPPLSLLVILPVLVINCTLADKYLYNSEPLSINLPL